MSETKWTDAQREAAVGALRKSRLTWGTHSDRWGDMPWQRDFWGEAADTVLEALAPSVAAAMTATQDRLADMTRQRDEAVKAFQRERARVGRVQALVSAQPDYVMTYALRAALADRPTGDAREAREAAVSAADDAGVAGQGSGAERAGEGK